LQWIALEDGSKIEQFAQLSGGPVLCTQKMLHGLSSSKINVRQKPETQLLAGFLVLPVT
jgi:hypothetical protein